MSESMIPYGYCHCGCGQKTSLATKDRPGVAKGEPMRYRIGHYSPESRRRQQSEQERQKRSATLRRGMVPFEIRFWQRVRKGSPEDCWEWVPPRDVHGYGRITTDVTGEVIGAHRASWLIHFGAIPDGMHICHKCDNPPCVNPHHLFLGTPRDNAIDKVTKGRAKSGKPRRGEQNTQAKVTEQQVREIRAYHAQGKSIYSLAKAYNISDVAAGNIVHRKTWKRVK